jgi:hypothetical protein
MQQINQTTVSKVVEYIKTSDYSIVKFLEDNNLLYNREDKLSGTLCKCPFHPDKKPSLRITLDGKRCNCFSCNSASGGYLTFTRKVTNAVLGGNYSFYQWLDKLIQDDPRLRLYAGSFSVLEDGRKSIEEILSQKPKVHRPTKEGNGVYCLEDLFRKMKRHNHTSIESIRYAIISLQRGTPPRRVFDSLREEDMENTVGMWEGDGFEDMFEA